MVVRVTKESLDFGGKNDIKSLSSFVTYERYIPTVL